MSTAGDGSNFKHNFLHHFYMPRCDLAGFDLGHKAGATLLPKAQSLLDRADMLS